MKIRIMSNNQWTCDNNLPKWIEQGLDCSTKVRSEGFAKMFTEIDADIIGLQECSPLMARAHMDHFLENGANYALLWGRDTPIIYKPEKFELIDSKYFVYPTECPGFEGSFNNSMTKSYCIAVLKSKENGKLLIFATTHLWWMNGDSDLPYFQAGSHEARTYQLNILMDEVDKYIEKYSCPAIIVGDLNTTVKHPALLSAFARGYASGLELATDYAYDGHGYHRCDGAGFDNYVPKPAENSIDHILVKNAPAGFVKRFDRFTEDYYMPLSDHLPLWIDVEY